MAPSTAKRIVVYRFDRQPAEAIVQPATFLLPDAVEVISLDGNLQTVAFASLKAICFVADTCDANLFAMHQTFDRRPKSPGLWTRFTFRDGDRLDGVLSHNLLEWPQAGYLITPPHAGANRQKVFLPRAAVTATELRGVVGTSAQNAGPRRRIDEPSAVQLNMFD